MRGFFPFAKLRVRMTAKSQKRDDGKKLEAGAAPAGKRV
jgi:hypothetical protein